MPLGPLGGRPSALSPIPQSWATAGRYGSFGAAAHGILALLPSPRFAGMPDPALPALSQSQQLLKASEWFLSFPALAFVSPAPSV